MQDAWHCAALAETYRACANQALAASGTAAAVAAAAARSSATVARG